MVHPGREKESVWGGAKSYLRCKSRVLLGKTLLQVDGFDVFGKASSYQLGWFANENSTFESWATEINLCSKETESQGTTLGYTEAGALNASSKVLKVRIEKDMVCHWCVLLLMFLLQFFKAF